MSAPNAKVKQTRTIKPRTDVELVPTTVRITREIYDALPDIVLFEHRAGVSDLLRDWIVDSATKLLRNPTYQKWLRRKQEAGK